MTANELSIALSDRGLLAKGQQVWIKPADPGNTSPWYVQVVLGVSAWFAGLFLLGFVVFLLADVLFHGGDNWILVGVLGACVCLGAAFLYAVVGEASSFGNQFALAMSFAGQVGIAVGLGGTWGERVTIWGMLVVELVLIAAMNNRLQRVLSSLGAVIAWALATHEMLFGELPGVSIWRSSRPEYYQMSLVSIALWLVVWAPVAYAAYWLVTNEARWMADGHEKVLRPVTYGVLAGLSIAPLATHPASFWMALGLGSASNITDGSIGSTALWPLLAMFLAVVALALAFMLRNCPLMGVAILFGLLEFSSFYYVLGATLLVKSIIMIVLGVGLVATAYWLARPPAKETV